jgi:choline monooxygenase
MTDLPPRGPVPGADVPRVDADVAHARPLPGACYVHEDWARAERTAVFARSWQLATHEAALAAPGSYVAVDVAGHPVVVVRSGAELRAYHNVCRHRGGPLAEGCGTATRLTCRYHGWSYGLDGRLLRAPLMDAETAAHDGALDLRAVAVAAWAGLVFVNLDPDAAPFDAEYAGLDADARPLALGMLRFRERRTYAVAANWKVYVDNYLEGYHVPAVHPALNRELDFRAYVTALGGRWVVQHAPVGRGSVYGGAGGGGTSRTGDAEARYYWLWPNAMLNCYEGLLQVNVVEPAGVDRCRVHFDWYLAPDDDGTRLARLAAFSDEVQAEDASICAALQRNLGSPGFEPGPYSTRWETGVHRFHRLYAAALGGA